MGDNFYTGAAPGSIGDWLVNQGGGAVYRGLQDLFGYGRHQGVQLSNDSMQRLAQALAYTNNKQTPQGVASLEQLYGQPSQEWQFQAQNPLLWEQYGGDPIQTYPMGQYPNRQGLQQMMQLGSQQFKGML